MFVPLLSNNHREIHVNHHQTPLTTMNHYYLLLNNNIYIYKLYIYTHISTYFKLATASAPTAQQPNMLLPPLRKPHLWPVLPSGQHRVCFLSPAMVSWTPRPSHDLHDLSIELPSGNKYNMACWKIHRF